MAQLHSSISITYSDYDLEHTTITVKGKPVLADGTNYVLIQGYWDAVEAALDALVLGTKISVTRTARAEMFEEVRPASKVAQRETKLFISGHGDTNFGACKLSLGTFDPAELATIPAGQNLPSYLDLSAGNGLALKTALDDYWALKPDYTENGVVDDAVHVGRNT